MTKSEAEVVKALIAILHVYDADSVDEKLNFRRITAYQFEEFCKGIDAMIDPEKAQS